MTVFLRNGTRFTAAGEDDIDMLDVLPAATYIVLRNPANEQLYLQSTEPFTIPAKLFGNIESQADRILTTYIDRPGSTGVLLAGDKGSGKTQLARLVAYIGAQRGIPTIVINAPHVEEDFFKLIQSITQPCIIIFDEFEKVYDEKEQPKILTLLDGVFPSKKLFILTCNDRKLINSHMRNRPGRIFYLLDFKGMEKQAVIDYCEDQLKDQRHIPQIVKIAELFSQFNFDMLKSMVEEMNRYNETPEQVLALLNARPSSDSDGRYNIVVTIGGKTLQPSTYYPKSLNGSPMNESEIAISVYGSSRDSDGDDQTDKSFTVRQNDLVSFDPKVGVFEYHVGLNEVKFVRAKDENANFFNLIK